MWNEDLLLPISEINELLLGVLRSRARSPQPHAPRLVADLRELWCSIHDDALRGLSRCPYLLLDAGFAVPERWEPGRPCAAAEPGSPGTLDWPGNAAAGAGTGAAGAAGAAGAGAGYFETWDGISMVRHALVLARYLARSHRSEARMLIALQPACAELIANRSLQDLETLAGLAPDWIQPRWESQPLIWRQMLQAAIGGSTDDLQRVQLRGLQLMALLW